MKMLRDIMGIVVPGSILLTETNVPNKENLSYFGEGDEAHMVYQFSLAPLLLHTLLSGDSTALTTWATSLAEPPSGCTYMNFAASHDGVGLRPAEGLLSDEEIRKLVSTAQRNGAYVSYKQNSDGSKARMKSMCLTLMPFAPRTGDEMISKSSGSSADKPS